MEIRITVTDLDLARIKEFHYILNDVKRRYEILKELTKYVCSKNRVIVQFIAFNSEKKFMFEHMISIQNTEHKQLINSLLKSADMYVITGATLKSLEEITKDNKEE